MAFIVLPAHRLGNVAASKKSASQHKVGRLDGRGPTPGSQTPVQPASGPAA
jgi:hypothetical protein